MIRVASLPWSHPDNAYLRLYYDALKAYGFELYPGLEVNDHYLLKNREAFDVIHIHWTHEELWRRGGRPVDQLRGLVGLWRYGALARRLGKTLVWTVHDLQQLEQVWRVDRFGNALLGRIADLCICHSELTRVQLLKEYWGRPDTTMVMPMGNYDGVYPVAKPRPQTLADLGLSPDKRTLLACGWVRHYKGFDLALDLARQLGSDYQVIVGGSVYDRTVAADLARRAELSPNARLLARSLSDREIADLHAAADCVLFPYRRITGSASLLTALTLGRGVVASDLPFFKEYLSREPEAGVLFPVANPDALVAAVRQFFDRPPERRHAAARRIADELSWSKVVRPVARRLHALCERAARRLLQRAR